MLEYHNQQSTSNHKINIAKSKCPIRSKICQLYQFKIRLEENSNLHLVKELVGRLSANSTVGPGLDSSCSIMRRQLTLHICMFQVSNWQTHEI